MTPPKPVTAHTPDDFDFDDSEECWECGGEGVVYNCMDEIGCVDPESGCDFCKRRCQTCKGKGRF